jgi:uncharacterized protein (TIGR01777 family)
MKKFVLAGGSGFLGRLLAAHFHQQGHEVFVLTREPKLAGDVKWDIARPDEWAGCLDGADVLINLAGRSVNCRYNAANRKEIMDSRVLTTRALGEAIRNCARPPRVWLNASTATIYKHTFGPAHSEEGEIGATPEAKDAFSIEVARAWEEALFATPLPGVRQVAMRSAMVLGHGANSVFPMLCRLARFGLGGKMGNGKQYVSWIHAEDFCGAMDWILDRNELAGVINVAAPNPLTNAEMMRIFRKAVGNPIGLPATEWMLEIGALVMGTETELILKSRRVAPARLLESGFSFQYPTFDRAVENLAASKG